MSEGEVGVCIGLVISNNLGIRHAIPYFSQSLEIEISDTRDTRHATRQFQTITLQLSLVITDYQSFLTGLPKDVSRSS